MYKNTLILIMSLTPKIKILTERGKVTVLERV